MVRSFKSILSDVLYLWAQKAYVKITEDASFHPNSKQTNKKTQIKLPSE